MPENFAVLSASELQNECVRLGIADTSSSMARYRTTFFPLSPLISNQGGSVGSGCARADVP